MRQVIIIGDSGHAKVVKDVVDSLGMDVIAKLDDKYSTLQTEHSTVKAPISYLSDLVKNNPEAGIIIGIGSNYIREKLVNSFKLPSSRYVTLVHPSAVVSPSVKLGIGTVVMPGAIINADTSIGNHVIINSASVIEHDCTIGDFSHISPAATLTGSVQIGRCTHIGAGSTVIPMKKVGDRATIGAGAVVVSNIDENVTAIGIPAKVLKREGN